MTRVRSVGILPPSTFSHQTPPPHKGRMAGARSSTQGGNVRQFLHHPALNIPGVIDQDVNAAVDLQRFLDDLVEVGLRQGDVEIEDGGPGVAEMVQPCGGVPACGDDAVAACQEAMDKVRAEAGGAAGYEPG